MALMRHSKCSRDKLGGVFIFAKGVKLFSHYEK